jgi:hypothetical protein
VGRLHCPSDKLAAFVESRDTVVAGGKGQCVKASGLILLKTSNYAVGGWIKSSYIHISIHMITSDLRLLQSFFELQKNELK